MAFRGGEAIGAEGDLVVTLVGQNVVDEAQAEYADKCTSGLEVCGATLRFEARARCARRVRSAASCTWLLVIDGCLVEGRVDGRGMNDASVAGVRGATVTVRGGAHVVAASSGSGEDCRFFCVYAFDGQFAVDASSVDATGASAGVPARAARLRWHSL